MIFTLVLTTMMNTAASGNMMLSNQSNLTNFTYQVVLSQFNSSNCSIPFYQFNYLFNCSNTHNQTWCCNQEYDKLNTSFGNAECNRYDENDTYVHFSCDSFTPTPSKKMSKYEMAGIAVAIGIGMIILIYLLVRCLMRCNRSRYDRL